MWILNFLYKYVGTALEFFDCGLEIVFKDIVAEDNRKGIITINKTIGIGERIGNAAIIFVLNSIRKFHAVLFARTEKVYEISRIFPATNDQNFVDARSAQGLDRIQNHRFVIDRQEVL